MGLAMNLAIVCTAFQFYFAVHIFLGVSKVQFLARNAVPLGEKWGLKGAVLGHVMAFLGFLRSEKHHLLLDLLFFSCDLWLGKVPSVSLI